MDLSPFSGLACTSTELAGGQDRLPQVGETEDEGDAAAG
jgi:hypothetical protein